MEQLRNLLLSAGLKQPFSIFDVCSKFEDLAIRSCPFITKGLRGMAILADKISKINCILVNANLTYEEQNFHGFHELIHIYTSEPNSGQTFNCYDKIKPYQSSYIEWIANEGAAECMVPYKKFLPLIKDNYHKMIEGLGTFDFCNKVASDFAVTPTVIQNRLNSLCYEIAQYINGASLENINILSKSEQQRNNIFIPSLNDLENERLSKSFHLKIS